ncbi:unnamed protein product [Lepeophtheirus salmonis]|uniref:(salmon louse) hypothetical protein n=1 Tax=Lepeophtheirus salmonis TaxID=72036 RepID=A0A7R8CUV8_LEPSM|nr:unnamed protein product [Lepeophtheirus salmonis]CAF2939874.1 unnamed protein product [Lepeophtheirus salmonis]
MIFNSLIPIIWSKSFIIAIIICNQSLCTTSNLECGISSRAISRLTKRINGIKSKCGEVCNTNVTSLSDKDEYFKRIQKDFDCHSLFSIKEGISEFNVPLKEIPEFLKNYYLYNDRIPLTNVYMRDESSDMPDWGPYGYESVKNLSQVLKDHTVLDGARVLVIGSQSPWIEAILLDHNVKEIVTLEYSEIVTTHPKIKPVLPQEFNRQYLSGELEPFDLTVSFSSLEHSGLGRYGDPLNPWGDLITMARTWCTTKKGGRALIGVPTGIEDEIIFNAAKIYGPLQYSHLFANWKPIYSNSNPDRFYKSSCKWCYQPLFVVEK